MIRNSNRLSGVFTGKGILSLTFCGASFSGGCLAGVFFSALISESEPVVQLIKGITTESAPALQPLLWHGLVFALGFFVLGVAAVPFVLFMRGLCYSYAVSLFIRVLGPDSVPYALRVFLPEALLSLPFLFFLSVSAVKTSSRLLKLVTDRGQGIIYTPGYFMTGAVCTILPAILLALT